MKSQLEKDAQHHGDFYQGGQVEDVFANFDPNTGKRIRPDEQPETEE